MISSGNLSNKYWKYTGILNLLDSRHPDTLQLARDVGILLARAAVVHHEDHVVSHQPYVDMCCSAGKAHHLPVKMAVAWG